MNFLKGSHSCRICRVWFEGQWSRADAAGRRSIARQMDNGMCDECQHRRLEAALQLIRLTDVIRVYQQVGLPPPDSVASAARQAEQECTDLKMWPPFRRSNAARYRENGATNDHDSY